MYMMKDGADEAASSGATGRAADAEASGDGARDADDRRAITRCLSGDLDAFAEVVARHQDRLMWTAYHILGDREEAADAVQETFLRAYRALGSFGGDGYVGAWIGRIAVNVCVSLLRGRAARPVAERGSWDWGRVEGRYAQAEQGLVLAAALAQLDVQDRIILLLRHVHGLSSRESGRSGRPWACPRTRCARGWPAPARPCGRSCRTRGTCSMRATTVLW